MAKKSQSRKKRKQRKPNVPTYKVPTESAEETKAAAQPANGGSSILTAPLASTDATTESIDWAKEYPYFASDMKRLGIVVLIMVVLLLALNLIFIYAL
ncbi:MAG TPA: hypothetical protein ENK30_01310 [Anaerolineae bacterium]|nr:hypothetical protein [Anaerolineae bacterium]